jgi:ABC-type antimicrobial peptide transport system permease subunit
MNLKGQLTILGSNLGNKKIRTLLASAGIIIGITCISITTTLSLGVLDTITKAINSQYIAREVSILKTKSGSTDFMSFLPEDVKAQSFEEMDKIKKLDSNILEIYPANVNLEFLINKNNSINCRQKNFELKGKLSESRDENTYNALSNDFNKICSQSTSTYKPFLALYESNKKNWIGSTNKPNNNEIIVSYDNTFKKNYEFLNINNARDLIGKEFKFSFDQVSGLSETKENKPNLVLSLDPSKELVKTFKVASVIDNSKSSSFSFDINPSNYFYFDYSIFEEVMKSAKTDIKYENIGFYSTNIIISNYDKVEQVVNNLKNNKYLASSPLLEIINIVTIIFRILTAFFSAFGLIALLVSVFGIVNVISMSVLERQKEIGILKSLGASNNSIFGLFIGEGLYIGFLGWLIGTGIAVGILSLINYFVNSVYLPNDKQAQDTLNAIGINNINLTQPLWLYGVTLGIALFFTSIASLIPSIGASRKRPVDVLRNE